MKTLFLCVFVSILLLAVASGQESLDACALVKSATQYDGKTVIVIGFDRTELLYQVKC